MFLHSFGALGIAYQMTMDIMEEFAVKKCIYKDVPFDLVQDQKAFDFLNYYNDYVSFFTDWKAERMTSLWISERIFEDSSAEYDELVQLPFTDVCDYEYYGGQLIERQHPAPELTQYVATTSSGIGMWHDKIYYFPPEGLKETDDIQSEFYVEYHHLPALIDELYAKRAKWHFELVKYSEFRPLEQDQIPLSPAKNQQVYSIHFSWINDFNKVYFAVEEVQKILKKYEYRVHWAKFFRPEPEFALFETFDDDLELLKTQIDSFENNKFKNCWIERILYGNYDCSQDSIYERNVDKIK